MSHKILEKKRDWDDSENEINTEYLVSSILDFLTIQIFQEPHYYVYNYYYKTNGLLTLNSKK